MWSLNLKYYSKLTICIYIYMYIYVYMYIYIFIYTNRNSTRQQILGLEDVAKRFAHLKAVLSQKAVRVYERGEGHVCRHEHRRPVHGVESVYSIYESRVLHSIHESCVVEVVLVQVVLLYAKCKYSKSSSSRSSSSRRSSSRRGSSPENILADDVHVAGPSLLD